MVKTSGVLPDEIAVVHVRLHDDAITVWSDALDDTQALAARIAAFAVSSTGQRAVVMTFAELASLMAAAA